MTTTDHWREADDRGTVQTHASGDWLMVCIDGRWFLARSVARVDPGDPSAALNLMLASREADKHIGRTDPDAALYRWWP